MWSAATAVAQVTGRRGAARQQRHSAHAAALHGLHEPAVVVAAEQKCAVGALECLAQAGPVVEIARHGAHAGRKLGAVPAHDRPDLMTLVGENLHERPADVAPAPATAMTMRVSFGPIAPSVEVLGNDP